MRKGVVINMVKKLTVKNWTSAGWILLFCIGAAVFMLWENGPAALTALSGSVPKLAQTEKMENIYGLAALGLFFAVLSVVILIRMLTNSVKKRVDRYLEAHPSVTMDQLDSDFAAAEKIGNLWIGKKWTCSHDLSSVVLDNDKIAWVYSESERSRRSTNYYVCFGMADGTVSRVGMDYHNLSKVMDLYAGFSHIVVGNDPENGYLFKNDRTAFLEKKYNQKAE